ncbi:hypothetical protein JB92DRAFT_3102050 [Gautieria morchelliformis]|nr:hypothetical protein JB92DRAFT_3102050 [Gautieria morchelliformis]
MSALPSLSLQQIREENRLVYHTLASSTILIWNFCISFNQEIDFVWRAGKKWTLINVLFCILRYLGLFLAIVQIVFYTNLTGLLHPSTSTCQAWIWFRAAGGPVLLYSAELLLIMRVYAFYDMSRPLLYSLLILLACHVSVQSVFVALKVPEIIVTPIPFPTNRNVGICLMTSSPAALSFLWIPTFIVEGILFGFIAIRAIQLKPWSRPHAHGIVTVLIRDGSWTFLCIFAASLWLCVAFQTNPEQGNIALTWGLTMIGYCGTPLILNLRSEALKSSATTVNTRLGMILLDDFAVSDRDDRDTATVRFGISTTS